jgi:hypothetical protein
MHILALDFSLGDPLFEKEHYDLALIQGSLRLERLACDTWYVSYGIAITTRHANLG